MIARTRHGRVPCYLAVLKDFGAANALRSRSRSPAGRSRWISPRGGRVSRRCSDGFDELVAAAGGRVYLTKDARMSRDALEAMYPRLDAVAADSGSCRPRAPVAVDLALRTG